MSRWVTCCITWVVVMALIAMDAMAQAPGANAKIIEWKTPTAATSDIYVGILGEVAKPAVYHLDPQSLTLQSVIRRAGGLTDEASRTIRIVRQDRVVQSVFLSPQTDGQLLPGDLLVIESKRTQAAVSKMYEADPRLRAMYGDNLPTHGTSTNGIQLAFLNVLDRPVIVKVRHEEANLTQITQMLGQPAELAQSVRVISPDRLLSQAVTQSAQAAISDGSVLVFPQNSINRHKLPSLPIAFESGIATGALPSLIGGSAGQSPELRNVGQLPPLMARQVHDGMSHIQSAGPEHIAIPTPNTVPSLTLPSEKISEPPSSSIPMPAISSKPRIATLPFSGSPRVTSSSATRLTTPELNDQNTSSEKPAIKYEPHSSDGKLKDLIDDDTSIEDPDSGTSLFPTLLGIGICIAGLIALALFGRRTIEKGISFARLRLGRTRLRPIADVPIPAATIETPIEPSIPVDSADSPIADGEAHADEPPQIRAKSLSTRLDQLIHNELRIREEQVQFPQQIVLQGRIIPPPIHRVDTASRAMQGPHFDSAELARARTASLEVIGAETKIIKDELDHPHMASAGKPHFLRRRPGENTVAAAASTRSTASADAVAGPEAKISLTPVTDALRQLQGDLS